MNLCMYCGKELVNDDEYDTVARCKNFKCEMYNIPVSV